MSLLGVEIHRQMYVQAKHDTNRLIIQAKQKYIKDKLIDSKDNPKELYRIIDCLTKNKSASKRLPNSDSIEDLCEEFNTIFIKKITDIRADLDLQDSVRVNDCENHFAGDVLNCFELLSVDQTVK